MIVVAGEALIDLIDDGGAFRPHPGGGPFNTAVALGCLGAPVCFLGRLSDDRFGQLLATRFAESGVDARYVLRGPAPTPLAVVHDVPAGDHEFSFYLAETAYAELGVADLPQFGPEVSTLSAGTLALATDPPGGAIEALLERESEFRLIVIDPNVRPAVFGDRAAYRRRLEHWASFATLPDDTLEPLGATLVDALARLRAALADPPYSVVLHAGALDGGDQTEFHWHWEIVPHLGGQLGMEWATGIFSNPVPPEDAAAALRAAV